jgi:hypothetical protein
MVKKIIAKYYLCTCGECYKDKTSLNKHERFNFNHTLDKIIYLCDYNKKAPKENEERRSKTLISHE